MKLATFNGLSAEAMHAALMECCHACNWATRVQIAAPFNSKASLHDACDAAWQCADEAEILEAFSGHPQIGDLEALRSKYAATASAEQGQVAEADAGVLERLRDRNQAYFEKFGFIFIVCASGKSANEMLTLLNARIDNDRATELRNGAREQAAIMHLRIDKLIEEN